MTKPERRRSVAHRVLALATLWVAGSSCDSLTGSRASAIDVMAPSTVVVGNAVLLTATVRTASGRAIEGVGVSWSSSNPAVVDVDDGGLVRALSVGGPVTVTASADGLVGRATITVVPVPVASVAIVSPAPTLLFAREARLAAVLRDSVGGVLEGRGVSWTSSDPSVVAVTPSGFVTGERIGGPITIQAVTEGRTGATSIEVRPSRCPWTGTITLGEVGQGTLSPETCRVDPEYNFGVWRLEVGADTTVHVRLSSTAFDSYVSVTDAEGRLVMTDDERGGNSNAHARARLRAGLYTIWATSYFPGEVGEYVLSIAVGPPGDPCLDRRPLALDAVHRGTIEDSDCQYVSGRRFDQWLLDVASTTVVSVGSNEFSPQMLVWTLGGLLVDFTLGGVGSIAPLFLDAGRYEIQVGGVETTGRGKYELRARFPFSAPCSLSVRIEPQASVVGSLASSDCRLSDGSRADRYSVSIDAPDAVSFEVSSPAFDPFVYATDATGRIVASDDDSGGGTAARMRLAAPGEYVLWVTSYRPGGAGAYHLTSLAEQAPGSNLVIDRVHLTQATQDVTGSIPIVAGRDALLRVFVRADRATFERPRVRVGFYEDDVLLQTSWIEAPSGGVPTNASPEEMGGSWNLRIPGAMVRPGLRVLAEVDPEDRVRESNEADNLWPLHGEPRLVDVRAVPVLPLTMVPVQYASGAVGNLTTTTPESYVWRARAVWGLSGIDVRVREPFLTSAPNPSPDGRDGSWDAVLTEIYALRAAEGAERYYYGVLPLDYETGVVGLGFVGAPAAVGTDEPGYAAIAFAHELGHNLGRGHAPCGTPGFFPYPDGNIGVPGWNPLTGRLVPITAPDIMGYCSNPWVSDFNYRAVLEFLGTHPPGSAPAPPVAESVLLWGRVNGESAVLEPAIELAAAPTPTPAPGPYRLQALDETGGVLFDLPFSPAEAERPGATVAAFAFVVPRSEVGGDRVASLRLLRDGATLAGREPGGPASAAGLAARPPEVRGTSDGGALLEWDASAHPIVMIRSAVTGEIQGFARGGAARLPATGGDLDLLLSDGIRTTLRRVPVPARAGGAP